MPMRAHPPACWCSYFCFVSCFTLWCTPVAAQPDTMPTAAVLSQSCAGRLDRHANQVRNGRDHRHGCNAEFHARTSCPAIPYAAGANVRGAALAIPPKCTYNRAIETRQGGIRMENTLKQKLAAGAHIGSHVENLLFQARCCKFLAFSYIICYFHLSPHRILLRWLIKEWLGD